MTEELKTKLKLVRMVKEWLRTEHPEGNVQSLVHLILIFVEPREKQIEIDAEQIRALQKQNGELTDKVKELEAQIEQLQKINNAQKENLKKVRIALIQERTANIMNYGKGGVEMFDNMFEILKGVSN